jgi:hypothetical protein
MNIGHDVAPRFGARLSVQFILVDHFVVATLVAHYSGKTTEVVTTNLSELT